MIDCDVHVYPAGVETLFPYLPRHWVEHIKQSAFNGPTDRYYPKHMTAGATLEEITARPDLERMILNCTYAIDGLHNPDAAIAFASAVNDWLIAEWLEKDDRLRASLVVPVQLPEAAAQEIARVGRHPGFVQVFLPVRTQHPLGSRLALLLAGGPCRHGAGIPVSGLFHHRRGCLRPVPVRAGRADRRRLHLAAGVHVAL